MPQDPAKGIVAALDAMQVALDMLRASLASQPRDDVRMVSIKEAARSLRLSERSVRRHAQSGMGTKIGGVWRIELSRINARFKR